MAAGFLVDFLFAGKQKEHHHIHEMCEEQNCHCEEGILRSAINHTVRITFFILLITFALNLVMHYVGEDALASLLRDHGIVGPILSGLVGLIPNCASSVVLTRLYLEGAMSFGACMSGLLVGAGVGLLVLFRANSDKKDTLKVVLLLYAIGVAVGILLELAGINVLV